MQSIDCIAAKCCVDISVIEGREERTYSVADPLHLTFKQDPVGAHRGIQLMSGDGSTTLPSQVDDLPNIESGDIEVLPKDCLCNCREALLRN